MNNPSNASILINNPHIYTEKAGMKNFNKLILLAFFLALSTQISFRLPAKSQNCLKIRGNQTYIIHYISSGEDDKNVKVEVFNNGKIMYRQ